MECGDSVQGRGAVVLLVAAAAAGEKKGCGGDGGVVGVVAVVRPVVQRLGDDGRTQSDASKGDLCPPLAKKEDDGIQTGVFRH